MSGTGKLFCPTETAGVMEAVGLHAPSFFLIGAILLKTGSCFLLLVGYKAGYASLAPVAFLGAATVLFHAANLADPLQGQKQMTHVLKNLAIHGALPRTNAGVGLRGVLPAGANPASAGKACRPGAVPFEEHGGGGGTNDRN